MCFRKEIPIHKDGTLETRALHHLPAKREKKLNEEKTANLCKFLKIASIVVLLAGLGSALLIYHSSNAHSGDGQIYEDGYAIAPEDTKQYLRELELYGGTANVLADEFRQWFAGLWRGKSLAATITCFTVIISAGMFYVSYRLRERR